MDGKRLIQIAVVQFAKDICGIMLSVIGARTISSKKIANPAL